jgi:hypothetical protein
MNLLVEKTCNKDIGIPLGMPLSVAWDAFLTECGVIVGQRFLPRDAFLTECDFMKLIFDMLFSGESLSGLVK